MRAIDEGGPVLTDWTQLLRVLTAQMPQLRFLQYQPLAPYTSFRIGGPARVLAFPENEAELSALLCFAHAHAAPLRILGGGSNLLIPDEGVDALVVRLPVDGVITVRDGRVSAAAGCSKAAAAQAAAAAGLSGLEFAHGIPGTVGGGIRMNAGAYGGEMRMVAQSVTALDFQGKRHVFANNALEFSYRHSFFSTHPEYVIVLAEFALTPASPDVVYTRMRELAAQRREKQPLEYPSAGSVFKRPEGHFAGKLIEDAGLKGLTIGGAQVSQKHAGFIVNRGGATAQDVRRLVAEIQKCVYAHSGVELECEIEMW